VKRGATIIEPMPQEGSRGRAHGPRKTGAVIIGGDFQGLGILRSLARQGVPICLLDRGACIARFSRYKKRFISCPDVREGALFFNFLKDLAVRGNLDGWIIYPNDDETVHFLAKYKERLEEHYRVPMPSWDVVKFAYEKRLTYELAQRCGIAIPQTFYVADLQELEQLSLEFPVIIKPSIKDHFYPTAKRKAIRVDDKRELAQEFEKAASIVDSSEIMIQELIPGGPDHLFSVGSLCRDGRILARVVARRTRQHPMDFGHATTYAETVDIPELEEIAQKILEAMGYYGLSEVEFMLDPRDGRYKLIEINARPWGWHTLAIGAGVDLPFLLYRDMLGEGVAADGFERNAKWIRLTTDIPTAMGEIFGGRMKLADYLGSLGGKKQFAVLSMRDPLPFFMELVMLPYLWKKRGF
jgi:predicted ATP-grasp superfamily ATP-dependent carboligase